MWENNIWASSAPRVSLRPTNWSQLTSRVLPFISKRSYVWSGGTTNQSVALSLFSWEEKRNKLLSPLPPSLGKDSTMCFYRRKSLFFHERFLSINLIDYSEPSRVPMFLVCFPSADEGRRTNIEDEDEKRSNWFSSGKLTNNIYTAFSLLSAWSTRWLSFKDFFFSL